MKKKCIIIGNCQHTRLELLLSGKMFSYYNLGQNNTNFSNIYDLINTKDIQNRDRTTINPENIASADLIITQHIQENTFGDLSTNVLLSYKKPDCLVIKIPNFYFDAPFFNFKQSKVIRPNLNFSSTLFGGFPLIDKFFVDFIQSNLLGTDVLDSNIINSIDKFFDYTLNQCLTIKELTTQIYNEVNELKTRETQFKLDIFSYEYINNLISGEYINEIRELNPQLNSNILKPIANSHPSAHYFIWLLKKIYSILGIKFDSLFYKLIDYNFFPTSSEIPSFINFQHPLSDLSFHSYKSLPYVSFPQANSVNLLEYYSAMVSYLIGYSYFTEPAVSNSFLKSIIYGHRQLLPCSLTESLIKKRFSKNISNKIISSLYKYYDIPIVYKDGKLNFVKAVNKKLFKDFMFNFKNTSLIVNDNKVITYNNSLFSITSLNNERGGGQHISVKQILQNKSLTNKLITMLHKINN